jgi:predicted CopG family antitoxin
LYVQIHVGEVVLARTISIADDVFEWLKREKGDKSYSEVLREFRDQKNFSEVNGANSLSKVSEKEINDAIEEAEKESDNKLREKF